MLPAATERAGHGAHAVQGDQLRGRRIQVLGLDPVVGVRPGDRVQRVAEAAQHAEQHERHRLVRRVELEQRGDAGSTHGGHEAHRSPIDVVTGRGDGPLQQHPTKAGQRHEQAHTARAEPHTCGIHGSHAGALRAQRRRAGTRTHPSTTRASSCSEMCSAPPPSWGPPPPPTVRTGATAKEVMMAATANPVTARGSKLNNSTWPTPKKAIVTTPYTASRRPRFRWWPGRSTTTRPPRRGRP